MAFLKKYYDVVILGGGLCGVAAALTLEDKKKKVLLVEKRPQLGWEITSAFHCEFYPVQSLFVKSLSNMMKKLGGMRGNRVDPPIVELLLHRLITDQGIDIMLYSYPLGFIAGEDIIREVIIGNRTGKQIHICADTFIDATEEASLWRQTNSDFSEKTLSFARMTVFLNNVEGQIEFPLLLDEVENMPDISIWPSVWDREVCVEFDLSNNSISEARLLLPKIISFLKKKFPQLRDTIVTHTAHELFPLDVKAHLRERTLKHPYLKNLFATGTWTVPQKAERQRINTSPGRLRLGEEVGMSIDSINTRTVKSKKVNYFSLPSSHLKADVIVVGGGVAGTIAALAAARQGAKVVLIENTTFLGGIGTGGGIYEYYSGVPGGLQEEVDARVKEISPLFTGQHKIEGHKIEGFVTQVFNPEAKKFVLEQMCSENNIEIIYESIVIDVVLNGERKHNENYLSHPMAEIPVNGNSCKVSLLKGVIVATPNKVIICHGRVVIDSTGDVIVATLAGAPFDMGREGDGLLHAFCQSVGYINKEGNLAIINFDSGYVDPIDIIDLTRARGTGIQQYWHEPFTNDNRLLYIAPILGIRQGPQIIGDYQLTLADEISARQFEDCVGYMQSNYDNHAWDYENQSDEALLWVWLLGNWRKMIGCDIPYRCLLPKSVEGLLVACRGLSVSNDAHYAFRMQYDMQRVGEAAGIAAALAARLGVTPREIDVRDVQVELQKSGAIDEKMRPKPVFVQHSVDKLVSILISSDSRKAIWPIVQIGKTIIPTLKHALCQGSSKSRFWVSVALAMLRSDEAVPELLNCVKERRSEIPEGLKTVPIWQSAIALLGRIGDLRVVPELTNILFDKTSSLDVLITVLRALGRIGHDSVVKRILMFLKRQDLPIIRELQGQPVTPVLGSLKVGPILEDSLWQIELTAAEALLKLGEQEHAREIIRRYSDDPRAYVRCYAFKLFKEL